MSSVLPVLFFLLWLALSLTFVSYTTASRYFSLLWIYGAPLISEFVIISIPSKQFSLYLAPSAGDQWRVDGQLSLARVFGDKSLKEHMSAKPDVSDLIVDLSCESLILGSNGLWAMFDIQEVVDTVKRVRDPVKAANQLVHEASPKVQ